MKPKLLFITQLFPFPTDSGGKIKTAFTLKKLADYFDITAVFISEEKPDIQSFNKIEKYVNNCFFYYQPEALKKAFFDKKSTLTGYLNGKPRFISKYFNNDAQNKINSLIKDKSVSHIYLDHFASAQFILNKDLSMFSIALDLHNIDSDFMISRFKKEKKILKKYFLAIEYLLLLNFEKRVRKIDLTTIVVTNKDKESSIKKFGGKCYLVTPALISNQNFKKKLRTKKSIFLFAANMYWPPNEDAAKWLITNIAPLLQKVSKAKIIIAGKYRAKSFHKMTIPNNIKLLGYQKELQPLLNKSRAFLLPQNDSSGIKLKTIVALSNGLPIIGMESALKDWWPTGSTEKNGLLIAKNSRQFIVKMISLLQSDKLTNVLSKNSSEEFEKKTLTSNKQIELFIQDFLK